MAIVRFLTLHPPKQWLLLNFYAMRESAFIAECRQGFSGCLGPSPSEAAKA
jgi:hypothetical protein